MIWGPSRSPNHLTVDSTIAPGTQERNAYPNNKCRGLQLILLIDDHHHSWNSKKKKKKKNGFPSSLDSPLEWQYSCGVVLYGYGGNNNNNNGKLRRFEGLERERRGKFETFREPTWWMREIYSSENDGDDDDDDDDDSLPSTQETFLYSFFNFYSLLYISPICFFCCFFFVFIWLRDKHYVRALNRLWVAQKWFKIFFVLFFYF